MEGIFTLGLEGCIEVLQESKTNEDRPKEGKLCTSSKEGGGQGSAGSDTDLDSKSNFSTYCAISSKWFFYYFYY